MIENSDGSESSDRLHQSQELAELDLDADGNWLDLDSSEEEDDVSLVSDLFRQISQEDRSSCHQEENLEEDVSLVSDLFRQISEEDAPSAEVMATSQQIEKKKTGLISLAGAIALAIVSLLVVTQFIDRDNPLNTVTSPSVTSDLSQIQKLQQLDNAELTRTAQQNFAGGDINTATAALKTLLDRKALIEAKQVISAIPLATTDTAEMAFLRGRFIWQSLAGKNQIAEIQTVRRYWQQAVEKEPNSVLYRNALGFAYYSEHKFNEAIDVWFAALGTNSTSQLDVLAEPANKQVLNNYAGIALALWRIAETQPPAAQEELIAEARKLGNKVLGEAPTDFQRENLSQDWMWTASTIRDWQTFLGDKAVSPTKALPNSGKGTN